MSFQKRDENGNFVDPVDLEADLNIDASIDLAASQRETAACESDPPISQAHKGDNLLESLSAELGDHNINDDLKDIYNPFETEDDDDFNFEKIVDHTFEKYILILNVLYFSETIGEDKTRKITFTILKKDVKIELAQYIRNFVVEESR